MKTNLSLLATVMLGAALGVSLPASAGDTLEPGMSLRIPFGGRAPAPVQLSVRLDYAHAIAAGAGELALPVALEWQFDSAGRQALYGNGLLLGSGRSWRSDAAEGQSGSDNSWGGNLGTVLLAAGAALALVVAVSGETAEDLQEQHNESFSEGGVTVEDDGDEECEVPVPDNPSADGCIFGI